MPVSRIIVPQLQRSPEPPIHVWPIRIILGPTGPTGPSQGPTGPTGPHG